MAMNSRFFSHIDERPLLTNAGVPGWNNPEDQGAMKVLISSMTGSTDINLGIGWLQAGEIHKLHHHPNEAEFYYILEGSSTIRVGDEVECVRAGSVVYIPAGVSHNIVNDSGSVCVILFGYNHPEYENVWD